VKPVGGAAKKGAKAPEGPPLLSMQVTARTYRYIEEEGQ
jgi:hypothetical protein